MKIPFILGFINNKDLKSVKRWEISSEGDYLKVQKGNSYIMIKKRKSYPRTFLKESGGNFFIGYGEPEVYNLLTKKYLSNFSKKKQNLFNKLKKDRREFLIISLSEKEVFIDRDEFCTIPIFYFRDKDSFVFSNKFSAVLMNIERSRININFLGLAEHFLSLESVDGTPIDKVKILTERTSLEVNYKGFSIKLPKNKAVKKEKVPHKNEANLFDKKLQNTLSSYENKIPKNVNIGIELSGGLDSATVAYFFAQKRLKAKLYSMSLPGKTGKVQKKKIRDLLKFINLKYESVNIKNKYPLSRYIKSNRLFPLYPRKEIYTEALESMLSKANKDGTEVMITGMGGDELFSIDERENIGFKGEEEARFRKKLKIPKFFTAKFKRNFFKKVFFDSDIPIPLVPYSVLCAHTSRNNIFIENGIWPIAPLGDSKLAEFCRGLSDNSRYKKSILRKYQKNKKFPESSYDSFTNEYFSDFFDDSLRGPLYDFIISLYKKSILDDLGIIDKKILIKDYRKFIKTNKHEKSLLFYEVAVMEIILQSLS